MTSSQQPSRPSCDPQDPATYQRYGLPVPPDIRARETQAYKNWVKDGGLDRFATAHGVKPDFIYHLAETEFSVIWAYWLELEAIPGLGIPMPTTPQSNGLSMSNASAQQAMRDCEEGWSSEEESEDENHKEQTGMTEEPQGCEGEAVKAVALDEHKDAQDETLSSIVDDL